MSNAIKYKGSRIKKKQPFLNSPQFFMPRMTAIIFSLPSYLLENLGYNSVFFFRIVWDLYRIYSPVWCRTWRLYDWSPNIYGPKKKRNTVNHNDFFKRETKWDNEKKRERNRGKKYLTIEYERFNILCQHFPFKMLFQVDSN